MNDRVFLDTNILIYLYSETEADKRETAHRALNSHPCVTSYQALNEAVNVWLKKFHWDGQKIIEHLQNIESVCDEIVTVQKSTITKAIELQTRYGYSYYDCLMLASARESGCHVILTEDMSDGHTIDQALLIQNPLR